MVISVASGKGGTGKTTVSANLAWIAARDKRVTLVDCDVEEPDAHFYLKPHWEAEYQVMVDVPRIDRSRCDYCGECSEFCRYNALAVIQNDVLVFDELCHGCGGCILACPLDCIEMVPRRLGIIRSGRRDKLEVRQGVLDIGEPMPVPVIESLRKNIGGSALTIVDCPPGTGCPVVRAVLECDYCILVTEPTPFGKHDLELAMDVIDRIPVPSGVVINKSDGMDSSIVELCRRRAVPVLGRIPYSREAAEVCSRGNILAECDELARVAFSGILREVSGCLQGS